MNNQNSEEFKLNPAPEGASPAGLIRANSNPVVFKFLFIVINSKTGFVQARIQKRKKNHPSRKSTL